MSRPALKLFFVIYFLDTFMNSFTLCLLVFGEALRVGPSDTSEGPCKTAPEDLNVDTGNSPLTGFYKEAQSDLNDLQAEMEKVGTDVVPNFKRATEYNNRINSVAI